MKHFTYLFIFLFSLSSCKDNANTTAINENNSTATVYYNGDIIDMVGDLPTYQEALVEKDGTILFIGNSEEAMKIAGEGHKMNDLKGKTMLPGFIDAHAHFFAFGPQATGTNLLPPPDGGVKNIDELVNELKTWAKTPENLEITGWIFGLGFDQTQLAEKRFPTKEDLDKVSTEYPILIMHISAHFVVMNSKGLELVGITKDTPNPAGGIIRRMPNSTEPNGVLEELAALPHIATALAASDPVKLAQQTKMGVEMAKSYGYTTLQDGKTMETFNALTAFANQGLFDIDIVSYLDYTVAQHMDTEWNSKEYKNHYRVAGLKVTLDGAPQVQTAWKTEPYLVPPAGGKADYKGYPAIADEQEIADLYKMVYKNNWQINSHANGDAAIDQLIRGLRAAEKEYGKKDLRNVLLHGQYIRTDQLDALKELNVTVSLFPLHTYYWGDWHTEIIGEEAAKKISPTRTALDKGLKLTIHSDAPVALPNLMRVVWIAASRTSRSGMVMGANERLTPYEALKCITDWSAYSHFEDDKKGTLEKGKLADLVVLSDNPLKVEVDAIKDIVVLKTIKEGTIVFERE